MDVEALLLKEKKCKETQGKLPAFPAAAWCLTSSLLRCCTAAMLPAGRDGR
jgi:hypothetical protein